MFTQIIPYLKAQVGSSLMEEEGQTFVEYALILVLIALAVISAVPSITTAVKAVFSETASALTT